MAVRVVNEQSQAVNGAFFAWAEGQINKRSNNACLKDDAFKLKSLTKTCLHTACRVIMSNFKVVM